MAITDDLVEVSSLVEKPEPENAPSNLGIVGRYILTPNIHEELERLKPGIGGEYQLTDAIDALAKRDRVLAYRFKGRRFDCGSIDGFVAATNYCYYQRYGESPTLAK